MATSPEEAAALLLQFVGDAQTVNYTSMAALTVLIFDYFLSLDREVELIWKRPKQTATHLFLINRYFSILAISVHVSFMFREVKTDNECDIFFYLEAATSAVIIPTVDLVLLLRVWVLYGKSKKVLYTFLPVILVEPLIMVGLEYKVIQSIKKNGYTHLGPMIKGCYPKVGFSDRATYCAMVYAPLALSTVMFFLTMYKCGRRLYELRSSTTSRIQTRVLSLLVRDGIYWFIAVLALFVTQIANVAVSRLSLGTMMINPCLVGYSVVSSRILLNMREMSTAEREPGGSSGGSGSNLPRSPINFRTPVPN